MTAHTWQGPWWRILQAAAPRPSDQSCVLIQMPSCALVQMFGSGGGGKRLGRSYRASGRRIWALEAKGRNCG